MPVLEKETAVQNWFSSDAKFNRLYPLYIQNLAAAHWTPLAVARKASHFLAVTPYARILDIGSGVGKFCLAAAHYDPKGFYTGIEQRKELVNHAKEAQKMLCVENVSFINGNFTQLDFRHYDHFYFYNPFYENLAWTSKIDDSIDYSLELYNYYNRYLFRQLQQKPAGTRIATFHSLEDEIPPCYHVVGSSLDNLLKFWIKV